LDEMTVRMRETAEEAGRLLVEKLDKPHSIEGKEGREFLTEADLESQALIRERLASFYPEVLFVGEEDDGTGNDGRDGRAYWLVDPLDGTANYEHGYPFFSVSIAFVDREGVAAGCVHDPIRLESFVASRGRGAELHSTNPGGAAGVSPVRVGRAGSLEESLLATGFPYRRTPEDLGFDIRPLLYFLGRARGIRRAGSAALDLCHVACGRLDGFWEEHLRPWDMAAGVLIVQEAGGIVLGWGKMTWSTDSSGVVAAAPGIMEEMLAGIP